MSSTSDVTLPASGGLPPGNRHLWWEVLAVLAVGVIPNLAGSLVIFQEYADALSTRYWIQAVQRILYSGCAIYVTLYLIARSGEPFRAFGVARPRLLDVLIAAVLVCVTVLLSELYLLLPVPIHEIWHQLPKTQIDTVLMVAMYIVAAYSEELIMRGYLITRLTTLFRSRTEAVLIAAILFAAYHSYQGLFGVISTLAFGILYGVAFLLTGRVWPLALAHALVNIRLALIYSERL